jgi:hypothetical protein
MGGGSGGVAVSPFDAADNGGSNGTRHNVVVARGWQWQWVES